MLRVIEELQHQSNKPTCVLTPSGSDAIMVISTCSTKTTAGNPLFFEVLHAITAKAEEEDFDVILQTSYNPVGDLQKCENKIKQKIIKGIIMLSSPVDESFSAQLDRYDIPVMVIGKVEGQHAHVYPVDTDNFGDSIALTDALAESGHQNTACLHALLDVHISADRVNGYKQSPTAYSIAVHDEWIVDGDYAHETTSRAIR